MTTFEWKKTAEELQELSEMELRIFRSLMFGVAYGYAFRDQDCPQDWYDQQKIVSQEFARRKLPEWDWEKSTKIEEKFMEDLPF